MKTIITTVGTSLLDKLDLMPDVPDELKGKTFQQGDRNLVESIKAKVEIKYRKKQAETICAELQTIFKIQKENPDIVVYLICTDTALSPICASYIQKILQEKGIEAIFEENDRHIVEGLAVEGKDASKSFSEKGFPNLMAIVKDIEESADANNRPILNISGGYKALIPVMTIMGQLYDMEVNYVYEDSEELIRLGSLPIEFDWGIVSEFSSILRVDKDGNDIGLRELDKPENAELKKELIQLKLIQEKDSKYEKTVIGRLFQEFSERESPLAMDVLGYYAELKLLEYYSFHNYYSKDNQQFQFATTNIPEGLNEKDLDLIIYKSKSINTTTDFVTFECKSINQIDKVIRQLKLQLKKFSRKPKEHCLCLYADRRFGKNNDFIEGRINDYQTELTEVREAFNKEGIGFSVKCFHMNRNNVPKNIKELRLKNPSLYANEFIAFMRDKISVNDYKKI